MKKGLLFLLLAVLLAALVFGGVTALTWQNLNVSHLPMPNVQVMDTSLLAASQYEWKLPVYRGFLYKDFAMEGPGIYTLGDYPPGTDPALLVSGPFETTVLLTLGGEELFSNSAQDFAAQGGALTAQQGSYTLTVTAALSEDEGNGYGWFSYTVSFTIVQPVPEEPTEPQRPAEATLIAEKTTLPQGDILSLQIMALPDGVTPAAETSLGMAIMMPLNDLGDWYCTIPIGNTLATGLYDVTVTAGELVWDVPVEVVKYDFVEQDLTIDVSDPVISEANSAAAYQQYREKIPPLFATYDEEKYWDGLFIQPAEGRISTEFGTIRYTNGDYANPSIHMGMDIAAAEGTEVLAPNGGRVVLAEYLLNTGNTIVIEHGGGLKSYYYHMSALSVETGDVVETGQPLGAVGTTGYSTGPHLHFEMRIGERAINPQMLFSADAGLYSAGAAAAQTGEDSSG